MIRKNVLNALFLLLTYASLFAQEEEPVHLISESLMLGIGRSHAEDTYLSDLSYSGLGFALSYERMKLLRANENISYQHLIDAQYSTQYNPTVTAAMLLGTMDYRLNYHYHFQPTSSLKLLAGTGAHVLLGGLYNSRNGNNPATGKLDLDLALSGMAIYTLRFRDYPITMRYQVDVPFVGLMFSPHYGQSYYEIFGLGNNDGIICFSSLHNKFSIKNHITMDFPTNWITIRAAYSNNFYSSQVNNLNTTIASNYFMLGAVVEFSFSNKRKGRAANIKSSIYD